MAVSWPSDVPDAVAKDFSEEPGDALIVSEVDDGPDQVRPRGAPKPTKLDVTIPMTPAELDNFLSWVKNDLAHGANEFTFHHPRRQETVMVRSRAGGRRPWYAWSRRRGLEYAVELRLEVLE